MTVKNRCWFTLYIFIKAFIGDDFVKSCLKLKELESDVVNHSSGTNICTFKQMRDQKKQLEHCIQRASCCRWQWSNSSCSKSTSFGVWQLKFLWSFTNYSLIFFSVRSLGLKMHFAISKSIWSNARRIWIAFPKSKNKKKLMSSMRKLPLWSKRLKQMGFWQISILILIANEQLM